jgi:hypothetical protein
MDGWRNMAWASLPTSHGTHANTFSANPVSRHTVLRLGQSGNWRYASLDSKKINIEQK